ncbi:MAG: Phosphoribosylaminoimidazole carboxylase ATPase subunit (EC [uncultured Thiotrichaceae bacterium]|uniref:N5-carboxyaminoimidazole ribonucleotide synthase n=1 Tax=uncultured Thiotrichaceae bacterium TaxID=298394 RepID=A0A6S6SKH4_9GAMM|nr:MAG: Phosphoribosylaminoimidazole carboxylase ATPase subunit (EC [uncultured Thiotrichaceae bacterium]
MLGGGQLGRMFIVAARELGYRVMVLEPDENSPAGQMADQHLIAAYDDAEALAVMASACDVVTTEFENIPAHVLNTLAESTKVRPSAKAVLLAQDRIDEKAFIESCGLMTAHYGVIKTSSDIADAVSKIRFPARLKTARLGYDGKGQAVVNSIEEVRDAFQDMHTVDCVLEQQVDLDIEISVVLARNSEGETECFPVGENIHKHGILHKTLVPASVKESFIHAAQVAAKRIADKLEYIGVLAVEFFITKDGELLVNEMAPRTHNSGHFTMDACETSQFEQQVRTVCDLPFGSTKLLSPVVMINMLGDLWGDDVPEWQAILSEPSCKLHLYGKQHARIGRKMGHYNVLSDHIDQAETTAEAIFTTLEKNLEKES